MVIDMLKYSGILKTVMRRREAVMNMAVVLLAMAFISSYIEPSLILSPSTASGGDMGSMIYLGKYMHDYLLPSGKIYGWSQDRWLGFPIFSFQFPLPYILMALLGYAIPSEIAFKLITVMGVFALPITTFFSMKWMRFRFPVPAISSAATLLFLFDEKNTIFGGNIVSMLAGEFSYSISFSLMVLFMGLLYSKITEGKFSLRLSILFAAVLFSHVVTAVIAAMSSVFFLISRKRKNIDVNFRYLFAVYGLSFLMLAFWLLPLFMNLSFTTKYGRDWAISSFFDWFPAEAIVVYFMALCGAIYGVKNKERNALYLLFSLFVSGVAFLNGELLFAANIRFWPMIYFFSLMLAAYFAGELLRRRWGFLAIFILAFSITVYLGAPYTHQGSVKFTDDWIKWNYQGYEAKADWPVYQEITQFIAGSGSAARTWNDLEDANNRFGTPRAFESLPYFSGKPTLEGVYAQATISSPFISYAQCEMSKHCAGIPTVANEERTTVHNLMAGTRHLTLMNVKYFIAAFPSVQADLAQSSDWKMAKQAGDWQIYELLTHNGSYVYVPEYEPNAIGTKGQDWKKVSLDWWVDIDKTDVPIVFSGDNGFLKAESLGVVKRIPIDNKCTIKESVLNEEIDFNTNCVGRPHIIKVSYFPNWHVEGASKIYLVSPSFMLVYPEQENVRLYYADTSGNVLGKLLTLSGIVIIGVMLRRKKLYRLIDSRTHP